MTRLGYTRRSELETARWRVGDTADFLGLTPEEAAFVDLKLALARHPPDVALY